MAEKKTYQVDLAGTNDSYMSNSQKSKSGVGRAIWAVRRNLLELTDKINEEELSKRLQKHDIQCDAETIKAIEIGDIDPPEGFIDAFKQLMQLDAESISNMRYDKDKAQQFVGILSAEVAVSAPEESTFASIVTKESALDAPLDIQFVTLLKDIVISSGTTLTLFTQDFRKNNNLPYNSEIEKDIKLRLRGSVPTSPPKLKLLTDYHTLLNIDESNQKWLDSNSIEKNNGLDLKQTFYLAAFSSIKTYLTDRSRIQPPRDALRKINATAEKDVEKFFTTLQKAGILTEKDVKKIQNRDKEIGLGHQARVITR